MKQILDESQQYTSAKTSINATKLPKTFSVLDKIDAVKPGHVIADIGGGRFDNASEWAKSKGATLHVFDPYNRTPEHNEKSLSATSDGKSHIVTVNNVLNVIKEPEHRSSVIEHAAHSLHPEGTAYFLIYEGDKSGEGKPTQQGQSWQNNQPMKHYVPEVEQHFSNVNTKHGLIVARHK